MLAFCAPSARRCRGSAVDEAVTDNLSAITRDSRRRYRRGKMRHIDGIMCADAASDACLTSPLGEACMRGKAAARASALAVAPRSLRIGRRLGRLTARDGNSWCRMGAQLPDA